MSESDIYNDQDVVLPLLAVMSGTGPNLLGRDWLSHLEVNLSNLNLIKIDPQLQETLDKYPVVFSDRLGCANGPPVKLIVPDTASPKLYKPRPLPYSLKDKVDKELDTLEKKGIISPVQPSPWAAPIVPV